MITNSYPWPPPCRRYLCMYACMHACMYICMSVPIRNVNTSKIEEWWVCMFLGNVRTAQFRVCIYVPRKHTYWTIQGMYVPGKHTYVKIRVCMYVCMYSWETYIPPNYWHVCLSGFRGKHIYIQYLQSTGMYVCLSVCLSACLCMYACVCVYICLSVCRSVGR